MGEFGRFFTAFCTHFPSEWEWFTLVTTAETHPCSALSSFCGLPWLSLEYIFLMKSASSQNGFITCGSSATLESRHVKHATATVRVWTSKLAGTECMLFQPSLPGKRVTPCGLIFATGATTISCAAVLLHCKEIIPPSEFLKLVDKIFTVGPKHPFIIGGFWCLRLSGGMRNAPLMLMNQCHFQPWSLSGNHLSW